MLRVGELFWYRFYKFTIVLILVIVGFLVSFFTGGFVLVVGGFCELWASLAMVSKIALILGIIFVVLLLILIIGFFFKIRYIVVYRRFFKILMPMLFILIIVLAVISNVIVLPGSGSYVMENYVEYIEDPLTVTMTRIIPLETAYAYAVSLLQVPTHTIYVDEAYIYYNGSVAVYNWVVEPEGFWNQIGRDSLGVILVDGVYPPKVRMVEKDLYWSLHRVRLTPLYVNSLLRELKALKIDVKPLYEDNIDVIMDGEVYILIPLKTWITGWDYSIPVLYGYAVVYSDGSVEVVEADKIMEHSVLGEIFRKYKIPVVPEVIAREWIEQLRWSPGYWEVVLYHKTFEIRDIGVNPQPYLVFDESGHLYWLFVVEPSGESYAVKYIIYVDAESIEPRILVYQPKDPLIGISKVETYIKKAHPMYDWGQFKLAEPIPIIINNTLYWKVTIITRDGRGVVSLDMVDAKTGNVYSLSVEKSLSINEFYNFLAETIVANITYTNVSQVANISTTLSKVRELEQRVEKMIDELESILRELRELEKILENRTETP